MRVSAAWGEPTRPRPATTRLGGEGQPRPRAGDGAGPGRSAGYVNRDGRDDIAVGLYASSAGAVNGGRIIVYSGRTGRILYYRASTVAGEFLGYDVVGLGDVNRDGRVDLLASAAVGNTVYVLGT